MTFPNFAGKHAHDAFFHPQDYIEYLQRQQFLPDLQMPQSIIFCYQSQLLRRIAAQEETERIEAVPNKFYLLKSTNRCPGRLRMRRKKDRHGKTFPAYDSSALNASRLLGGIRRQRKRS